MFWGHDQQACKAHPRLVTGDDPFFDSHSGHWASPTPLHRQLLPHPIRIHILPRSAHDDLAALHEQVVIG